jgi:hypothetical protein
MVSLVSAYQKIYPKSIHSGKEGLFYCFSKEQTPHPLIPDPELCFSDYEAVKEVLFPVMSLDLSAFNESFKEKIPVLYHESPDYLIYQLDEEGRVLNPSFMDYEGNSFEIDDEDYAEPFEDGWEEVSDAVKRFRGKYLQIIPTLELPEKIDFGNALEFSEEVYKLWQKVVKKFKPKGAKDLDYFGPIPSLVQFSPEYPVWNGDEDAFYFIGQVKMYDLGLMGVSFFIFYHPESRTIAQLSQMT